VCFPFPFDFQPYTIHILVNAGAIDQDNPILQPYLDEWEKVADRTASSCLEKFGYDARLGLDSMAPTQSFAPTVSVEPTMAPTAALSCVKERSLDTLTGVSDGDANSKMSGIMFDVESVRSIGTLKIDAFDINIKSQRNEEIEIWTKTGSWQEGEAQKSKNQWIRVFGDSTRGEGPGGPTKVTLEESVELLPGSTQAFYIAHIDDNDLFNIVYPQSATGTEHASDNSLKVLVGQAINRDPFQASRSRDFKTDRGFNGIIRYTECTGGRHGRRDLQQSDRQLDHGYIDNWNDSREKKTSDFSTKDLDWDPFRLWTSPVRKINRSCPCCAVTFLCWH
jgi:hypothetical protein